MLPFGRENLKLELLNQEVANRLSPEVSKSIKLEEFMIHMSLGPLPSGLVFPVILC